MVTPFCLRTISGGSTVGRYDLVDAEAAPAAPVLVRPQRRGGVPMRGALLPAAERVQVGPLAQYHEAVAAARLAQQLVAPQTRRTVQFPADRVVRVEDAPGLPAGRPQLDQDP